MYINIERSYLLFCLPLMSTSFALLPVPIINVVTKIKIYQLLKHKRKTIYKSEENLSASFTVEFCQPWEPKIVIGQPVIVFYQKSTIKVNTVVSSGFRLGFIRRRRSFVCSLKQIFFPNRAKCKRNWHDMSNLCCYWKPQNFQLIPSSVSSSLSRHWLVTQ